MKLIREAAVGAVLLLAWSALFSAAMAQQTNPPTVDIRIDSKALAEAPNEWARQTGLQLIFRDEVAASNKTSPRIVGTLAPEAALGRLLAGLGSSYEFINARTLSFISALAQSEKQTPKSKFADFGGVKVHYKTVGKGAKALVFIHGWTCSVDFWKQSINEFPEYRVIAVDLPGHGQSDKPRTDYTMDYFARSIEAVMRDAKIKKAVLIGHSMGTPVIRQFYRLYPKQTLGLVIVDGSLRAWTKEEMEQSIASLRVNYKENAAKSVDEMLQPIRDEKLKQEIRSAMLATPDYVGLSAAEGMRDEKIWTNDKINVPVLAILAEARWWKPDTETFFRSIAPSLDFRMWQGVSHFLMMEQPAVFNESVKLFVSRNKLL